MILEAHRVQYTYGDGTQALNDVDLDIPKGQFTILLGPNGSGKTTLFKVITGLLKPGKGEIRVAGKPFNQFSKEQLYRQIGFVFQDPNDQLFAPTVGEDVAFGPVNLKLPPAEVKTRVEDALGKVGILHLINKPIHYLSYGQKKRAAVAGVLAMKPEIMILDEPTAGLDPGGIREIMRLLVKLNKDANITMLMATHDVDLVPLYADRIFILYEGEMLLSGPPREVFAQKETIRNAQLRLPRVAHLAEILVKKDRLVADSLPLTIGEARRMVVSALQGEKGQREGKTNAGL
ncbi:MAG: energy-coupling factor ABC transporter ATP-binding protein [Firmicutes bacterium HGW-Firmicutes-14]|jgi:cobalt/nickel transport system ATP-binding protein|nr:MAG: energy-coupling factor ABC transporter ATP-binding protein [Firmicutes bacterium HGW-Firmicutes-14]